MAVCLQVFITILSTIVATYRNNLVYPRVAIIGGIHAINILGQKQCIAGKSKQLNRYWLAQHAT